MKLVLAIAAFLLLFASPAAYSVTPDIPLPEQEQQLVPDPSLTAPYGGPSAEELDGNNSSNIIPPELEEAIMMAPKAYGNRAGIVMTIDSFILPRDRKGATYSPGNFIAAAFEYPEGRGQATEEPISIYGSSVENVVVTYQKEATIENCFTFLVTAHFIGDDSRRKNTLGGILCTDNNGMYVLTVLHELREFE